MIAAPSPDTMAILLLVAPLLSGRSGDPAPVLTRGEYQRLSRHLWTNRCTPSDLLAPDADALVRSCGEVVSADRLRVLLARGFLLGQMVERWRSRAIWVVSRGDDTYPRRILKLPREDAPSLLWGCGDPSLAARGGLAVVGSRNADDALLAFTTEVGGLAARAGRTVVSGGARGVDTAAVRGALDAGGTAVVVRADTLERATLERDTRNAILERRLVLLSHVDPAARFHVGAAMARNKYIYALADVSLVVNSDVGKGGTWAGAVEQLDRYRSTVLHVRSTGRPAPGLDALRVRGAIPWPNPQTSGAFDALFEGSRSSAEGGPDSGTECPNPNEPGRVAEPVGDGPDPGLHEPDGTTSSSDTSAPEDTQPGLLPGLAPSSPRPVGNAGKSRKVRGSGRKNSAVPADVSTGELAVQPPLFPGGETGT